MIEVTIALIFREMWLLDSTLRTICDKIRKSAQTATNLSVTRTAISRPDAIEKMKKMLTTWIEHHNQQNMPLSDMVIQENARSLYGDLTKYTNDPVTCCQSWVVQVLQESPCVPQSQVERGSCCFRWCCCRTISNWREISDCGWRLHSKSGV